MFVFDFLNGASDIFSGIKNRLIEPVFFCFCKYLRLIRIVKTMM